MIREAKVANGSYRTEQTLAVCMLWEYLAIKLLLWVGDNSILFTVDEKPCTSNAERQPISGD